MTVKSVSELRQDLVSGDWIVIATGRAKRPNAFVKKKRPRWYQPKRTCPFEDPKKSGNEDPVLLYSSNKSDKDWWVQVIPNKFPAFNPGLCPPEFKHGPYTIMEGVGFHEVFITRDHDRGVAEFNAKETELLVQSYQERYKQLMGEDCVKYVSIFQNYGEEGGATIYHPHSQLIAIPVVPGDVTSSLEGSEKYFRKNKKCAHCVMTDVERKDRTRIVFENDEFIAVCPYTSRTAFEIVISPKTHSANFEMMGGISRKLFSRVLQASLYKLYKGLKDPAFNYFIHTAPSKGEKDYHFYHWHLEILPKTAIWAGFEIGTGIEICTIRPEDAAAFLRKQK